MEKDDRDFLFKIASNGPYPMAQELIELELREMAKKYFPTSDLSQVLLKLPKPPTPALPLQ